MQAKMKTADVVKIRNITVGVSLWAILATATNLIVQFVLISLKACLQHSMLNMQFLFSRAYSRKRVINQIIHDRKFAVFTGSTRQGRLT